MSLKIDVLHYPEQIIHCRHDGVKKCVTAGYYGASGRDKCAVLTQETAM